MKFLLCHICFGIILVLATIATFVELQKWTSVCDARICTHVIDHQNNTCNFPDNLFDLVEGRDVLFWVAAHHYFS
jgi:hypothetical protein